MACQNPWVDDAARVSIQPDPSQKVRADVFRHSFRASENVCHIGDLLGYLTCQRVIGIRSAIRRRLRDVIPAPRISRNTLVGSGTAADSGSAECSAAPLLPGSPKWARHVSYP